MAFTLDTAEYEALISFARRGVQGDRETTLSLEKFLRSIEEKSGITRDFIWVQWQEAGAELPKGTRFPETWPPELRQYIELVSRKIARVDVEAVLSAQAVNPVNVLVTRDPAAQVGWAELDDVFLT
jgi:hypothetical protein